MCVHTKPNPVVTATLVGWAITGAVLIVSSTQPGWGASLVIPALSIWAEAAIGVFLLAGSLLALTAGRHRQDDLMRRWRLDELGMWLAAGGWATYTIVAMLVLPLAAVHWLISMTFAAYAIVRILQIRRQRISTERSVERLIDSGGPR